MSTDLPLIGKIALVTGGARGIGLETSKALAKLGTTVVIGARQIERASAVADALRAQGLAAEGIELDVVNDVSRHDVYSHLADKFGVLDLLINNAAVWLESPNAATPPNKPGSQLPQEVLRETFEANFFGPVFLTQQLLPLLRKSAAGRIVNVSSIRGSLAHLSDPASPVYANKTFAYDTSKTALNAFTVQLADELRGTKIKVNAVHPGWVRTQMGGAVADIDVAEGAKTTIKFASLPADGPTGGFFYLDDRLPW